MSQIVRESGEILADASALSDVGVKHMETAAGLKIMGFRDQNSREPEEPGKVGKCLLNIHASLAISTSLLHRRTREVMMFMKAHGGTPAHQLASKTEAKGQ